MNTRTARIGRTPLLGLAVLLCVAAAAGVVILLVADPGDGLTLYVGSTAVGLLVFGLAAAAGWSIAGYRLAWIGWLCVVVAVTGFGLTMGAVWSSPPEEEGNVGLFKAAGCLLFFSLALAQVCLMLGRLRSEDGMLIRALIALTVVALLALATLFSVMIVRELSDELYFRITAVVAVLATLGTALVAVLGAARRAPY